MSDPAKLTDEDMAYLNTLHIRGFAVSIFTPREIGAANPRDVKHAMIEGGWSWLEQNTPDEENDDE